jgi:hypothetical protein
MLLFSVVNFGLRTWLFALLQLILTCGIRIGIVLNSVFRRIGALSFLM